MKKLNLNWFDIALIALLGVAFILVFIPFNPFYDSEPQLESATQVRWYSLLTYTANLAENNKGIFILPFTLFLVFDIAGIVCLLFNKKLLFKFALTGATVSIMFFAQKGWPVNIFVSVISAVFLILLLILFIIDGFKNRREIRERAEAEKNKQE